MKDSVQFTILLCTYNRAKLLKALMESLIKQLEQISQNDTEILVINNNSTDETEKIILGFINRSSNIKYHIETRQGLAKARNKGIELASGKIIVFIDDDILIHEEWLKEIRNSIDNYPYKAFGGKIIPLWEKEKPQYINLHGIFKLNQKIFPSHDNGDEIKHYPLTNEETNPIGANMWIFKELFLKYGNFREDLGRVGYGGIPCEDTEFCSRLLKKKEPILYYPKAIVYHPVSSFRMSKEFIKSWHYRNGISTVRKGDRRFPAFDFIRFLTRLIIFIPFYLLFFLLGLSIFNKRIYYWSEFRLIRILGQLREFTRIWLKIPLKDPTF